MVFGRRKSSNNVETQQEEVAAQEARRRNRLSKPLTNKSTSNLVLLALQDSNVSTRNASSEVVAEPESPPISETEKRQQIKAHLFDSLDEPEKKVSRASWSGVAALVNRFESSQAPSNSSQTSLVSSPKPKASATSLFSSRRSSSAKRPGLRNASSAGRVPTLYDLPTNSSSASFDRTPERTFPTTRRASFQPGVATRKISAVDIIQEQNESTKQDEAVDDMIEEEATEDSDVLSFSEGDDEEWFPPPPEARSETPQFLDYTHLGGLHLGSLQVTNGRASPSASVATSMASRQLLTQIALRRNASSEYGDSEDDDGPPLILRVNPRTSSSHSRQVSWYSQRPSKLQQVESFERPTNTVQQAPAVDVAAEMAAEYIADLPTGPYAMRRRDSEASSRQEQVREIVPFANLRTSASRHSLRKSQSLETTSHRSSSPVSSVHSSTGSVLRTTTKRTEIEDELFDDETLGLAHTTPESEHLSDKASVDSFHSWRSPAKPEFARSEAFESAIEFQHYLSPQKSPRRASPPQWEVAHGASVEGAPPRLELPGGMVQSDSGYSSNNSVRSSSGERKSTMQHSRSQSPLKTEQTAQPEQAQSTRPAGKLHKPILKTGKTAPAVPSFSELRPTLPRSEVSMSSDLPKIETEKPKTRKKLQKRNVFGKKKKQELYIQSVASFDDRTIPAIPLTVQANLQIRTQQVPELEKTYKTMHHVRNQASMSTMNLPNVEMRFPSPEPDPEAPPPKTRRISWLPGSREEKSIRRKSVTQHDSMISEHAAKAIINGLGSDNYLLEGNPYDLAHDSNPTTRKTGQLRKPLKAPTQPQRPRSMFDDKTATEIARLRSSSIRERDDWNSRKSSFNDRGGIPGKNLRPASICSDAPPVPPLPRTKVLSQRPPEPSNAPPPPPPHSPRPPYIEMHADPEEVELAPAPPSHSPQPMDVTEVVDPCAAQAAAWKARRNDADQTMRRMSFHEDQPQTYHHNAQSEEPLYPEIPVREYHSEYEAQTSYFYHTGSHDDYSYSLAHESSEPQNQYQPYIADTNRPQLRKPRIMRKPVPQPISQGQSYDTTYTSVSGRPLPAPASPRRSPAPSIRSAASSLAEDLHPELDDEANSPHPQPEFGRYSGGLQYGYERQKGFGGSAGTRSVSGKADVAHKGVQLREGWGVDLGDVPVIGVMQRAH